MIERLTRSKFVKRLKAKGVQVNFSEAFKNDNRLIELEKNGFASKGLPVDTKFEYFVSDGHNHGVGKFTTSSHPDVYTSIVGIDFSPTIIYIFKMR